VKCVDCIQFVVLLTSLQVLLVGRGFAEDANTSAEPSQWSIAIGIPIGLEIQDVDADSETGFIGSPSRIWDDFGRLALLRPSSSGDSRVTGATFGGELEIMSPRIVDTIGRPRLFVRSALEMNLSSDTIPTAEGGIGPIRLPLDASGNPPAAFPASSVLGQGSKGLYKVGRAQVRVGAGVAFGFVFMDRRIRIKPSIEYISRKATMRGSVNRVIALPGAPLFLTSLDQARIEEVRTSAKRTFHGLGPGLELEVETGQLGPLVVSLFSGFRAYRFLGTHKEQLNGQTSAGERVTFNFEIDDWLYRADTGIRFRWQPE